MTTTKSSLVTFGINSTCKDGQHVIFIDIDTRDYNGIDHIIRDIQQTYHLSDFYIFNTKNGFHGVCLDKLILSDIIAMLKKYPQIDREYLKFALKRNNFTLRWGIDKQYYTVLHNNSIRHKKSYAHYIFLKTILNVSLVNYDIHCYDNHSVLEIQAYRSEKHGIANIKL